MTQDRIDPNLSTAIEPHFDFHSLSPLITLMRWLPAVQPDRSLLKWESSNTASNWLFREQCESADEQVYSWETLKGRHLACKYILKKPVAQDGQFDTSNRSGKREDKAKHRQLSWDYNCPVLLHLKVPAWPARIKQDKGCRIIRVKRLSVCSMHIYLGLNGTYNDCQCVCVCVRVFPKVSVFKHVV